VHKNGKPGSAEVIRWKCLLFWYREKGVIAGPAVGVSHVSWSQKSGKFYLKTGI
jgi:hypothetical protein